MVLNLKWGVMATILAVPLQTVIAATASPDGIRVQLKPVEQMVVSSELSGRLASLSYKEGDAFRKGSVIASVNCDVHKAKYQYAKARTLLAKQKYQVAQRLNKLESNSVVDVIQAKADFDMAKAEQQVASVIVERCQIKAPFSGRVSERLVEQGEFVSEGTKLLKIYSTKAYDVEIIVPSVWINRIKKGQTFLVTLDETGETYQATVTRIGSVIDALSQSFKVFGEIKGSHERVLMPGMSGSAQIEVGSQNDE